MKNSISYTLTLLFFLATSRIFGQNPEYVDPGNVRGDEDTIELWERPEVYVPVVIIVVLLVAFGWLRSKKRKR
jgi:hypothetical protein